MTTQDKLPPLAEVLRSKGAEHAKVRALVATSDPAANLDIERVAEGFQSICLVMADAAAPYDALIRQQEARIAELEQRVEEREADMHARIRAGYDSTVADCWRAKVAELEKERETFRKGFLIANDQAEHVTSLFLPVEAERDQLARKVAELEACRDALNSANIEVGIEKERLRAELAPYRELAREAHALQKERDELCASPEALVQLARIAMRLAALHKEE